METIMDQAQLLEAMKTAFQRTADQLIWYEDPERGVERALGILSRATRYLRDEIPGWDTPTREALCDIDERLHRAHMSLSHGQHHLVLMEVLRGLVLRPHHPELFFMIAKTCEARNDARQAAFFLDHVLWINPGLQEAAQHRREAESRMR